MSQDQSSDVPWYSVRFRKKQTTPFVPQPQPKKSRRKKKKDRKAARKAKLAVPKQPRIPYSEYLQSAWWQNKRKEKLKSVNYRCNRCGSQAELQVHHLHYRSLWKEKNNDLEVLCKTCHQVEHECLVQADSHLRSINNPAE